MARGQRKEKKLSFQIKKQKTYAVLYQYALEQWIPYMWIPVEKKPVFPEDQYRAVLAASINL